MRSIRLHKAKKCDKYVKELPKYLVGTEVLVRNFTRKLLERKSIGRYGIVKVLSDNAYELLKLNSRTFRVNVHNMRPYNAKHRKNMQVLIHNLYD